MSHYLRSTLSTNYCNDQSEGMSRSEMIRRRRKRSTIQLSPSITSNPYYLAFFGCISALHRGYMFHRVEKNQSRTSSSSPLLENQFWTESSPPLCFVNEVARGRGVALFPHINLSSPRARARRPLQLRGCDYEDPPTATLHILRPANKCVFN